MAELKAILRLRAFRRLWVVLGFSSIGDWLGLMAVSTFAANLFNNSTAQGVAFGGTIVVRLLPAFVLGPIAGVFADRFDRRRTMVICDLTRFTLYVSMPVVGWLTNTVATAAWIAIATFVIETCQMMWAPAKEASVPNLVPKARLEKANQLAMATTYGLTPILAGVVLALLNWLIGELGAGSSYDIALLLDGLTFLATGLMVWFGIREISGRRSVAPGRKQSIIRQFAEGWGYVAKNAFARGLVLGILGAFAAGGVVIGTGRFYARSLAGGDASFYLLFALLFVGLGVGIVLGPRLVGELSRRRWFGLSIIMAAAAVGLLAVAPHLLVAALFTVIVGAGAGMAFLNGITLLGAEIADEVRGRVYSFIQVSVQGVLMLAIALSSLLVGFGSSHRVGVGPVHVSVSATRLLLLIAGVVGVFAGYAALKQMDDKPGVPLLADLWSSLRGRPLSAGEPVVGRGVFVVFEGGEGAGKSTQAVKLAAWLRVRGVESVVTREPGATEVGARIRGLLLDRGTLPAGSGIAPRAEALLYAADRAHHVSTVVRPALGRGAVVISDRYVDSSLAYQGAGRTLPVDEVGWLSNWATGGLRPDLVVLLDVNPRVGLARVSTRGAGTDRLESESLEFHDRVRYAFLDLAAEDPQRYLVLDAGADPEEIAARVRHRLATLLPPPDQPQETPEPTHHPDTWPTYTPPPTETTTHLTSLPEETTDLTPVSEETTDLSPVSEETAELSPVSEETVVMAPVPGSVSEETARLTPVSEEDTTLLPTVSVEETAVLPTVGEETALIPAVADETAVLPAVSGDTAVMPVVSEPGLPEALARRGRKRS
jgi:dTMP kinase